MCVMHRVIQNHLDSLVFYWSLRVRDVLKSDAVKLPFVDVRDAVIFPSLRRRNRRLQIVAESILVHSVN